MPTNMRIKNNCELTAVELPKAILSVFARSDEIFQYMRNAHQPPPCFVRISEQTKRDLKDWARRHLDYKPTNLLWRGLPVIGPSEKPPIQHDAAP